MLSLFDIIKSIVPVLSYWWFYTPIILLYVFIILWTDYSRQRTIENISWTLLEIKIPANLEKSPKVTEHIFAGLHGVLTPTTWRQKFFEGKVTPWFSFEIVGIGGEIHFFVRTPDDFRNLVEAQIFAQYPDAEIQEVDDYINEISAQLPNEDYDMWGTEFKLSKDDVLPIKTYVEFEEAGGLKEAKRIDPLASFAENLSKLRSGEYIVIQILVQPTGPEVGDAWTRQGKELISSLYGKEIKKERPLGAKIALLIDEILPGGLSPVGKAEEKGRGPMLTPTDDEIAKAVNRSIGKLGFRCGIRFVYAARREVFHMSHVAGIMGAFKQFASQNLNSFMPDGNTITGGKGWFSFFFPSGRGFGADSEKIIKQITLYQAMRERRLSLIKKPFILNTEELATLFHIPGLVVKTPFLSRIESKKGQPPPGLPIE